jgi:hypothetical protein
MVDEVRRDAAIERLKNRESAGDKIQRLRDEPKSDRFNRRKERMEAVRSMASVRVRVNPRDEELRKVLKHPANGVKFLPTGSVEWPLDQFTKRRLYDGSVTLEDVTAPAVEEQQQPEPQQASAARQAEQPHQQPARKKSSTEPGPASPSS